MFAATVEKSAVSLSAISRHLAISERFRAALVSGLQCRATGLTCFDVNALTTEAPDLTEWRIIDHCAAITRMYAVFEGFVDAVLREYLSFLNSTYSYAELSDNFRANYIRGVGLIVSESNKQRYQHLPVHVLAGDLASALEGLTPYRLTPEAMLIQEQNLRIAELTRIFAHCGLAGLRPWIERHHAIRNFFSAASRVSDTPEAELREIVGYRNEAAHGEVDDVLGVAVLTEFAEFILQLCEAIAEFTQTNMLASLLDRGGAQKVGVVTETYRGNIMVAVLRDVSLAVGDTLYLADQNRCTEAKVLSLQLQNAPVDNATLTAPTEVGIKLNIPPKRRADVLIPVWG